jgi:hypothetical protein
MGHTSNKYEHASLAHADSVRLIKLLPGTRGSPLTCNIFEARKRVNPAYEALSYVWGEPVFSHFIQETSTNTILNITTNLNQALQAIRHKDTARVLWIDAVCINQTDLKEKGHQVALMGQIYHDATRVVIWLGDSKDGLTQFTSVLDCFVTTLQDWHLENWSASTSLQRRSLFKILEQPW